MSFPRVSTFKTPHQFQQRLDDLKLNLPFDETLETGAQRTARSAADFGLRTNRKSLVHPADGRLGRDERTVVRQT